MFALIDCIFTWLVASSLVTKLPVYPFYSSEDYRWKVHFLLGVVLL
jgi:hypothetical protein